MWYLCGAVAYCLNVIGFHLVHVGMDCFETVASLLPEVNDSADDFTPPIKLPHYTKLVSLPPTIVHSTCIQLGCLGEPIFYHGGGKVTVSWKISCW